MVGNIKILFSTYLLKYLVPCSGKGKGCLQEDKSVKILEVKEENVNIVSNHMKNTFGDEELDNL